MSTEPTRTQANTLTNRLVAGRYDVLEPLVGDGPLIVAYRARDRSLNRIVTLKTIVPAYADRDDVRSFLREGLGRSISLAHAGIARVYDVGEEPADDSGEGVLYLVEEHVRGIDLKERIRRAAPFQLAAANETAISIAEALDYAQTRGVSHGDLRPRVVLIGSVVTQGAQGAAIQGVPSAATDNQLKLTGFGIARAQAAAIAGDPNAQRLVVAYRAPESLRPDAVPTPTGDAYSLGVLLYELLTGALPGNTGADGIPPPSSANPNVPPALDGIIRMATALRPEERYASAGEMLTDLRAVRDALRYGKPLTWTPSPRPVAPPVLPASTPPAPPIPAAEATIPLTAIQLAPIPARPTAARQAVSALPVEIGQSAAPEATASSEVIEDLNDPYRNSASEQVSGQEKAAERRAGSAVSSHAVVPTGNAHPAFASAGASAASPATSGSAAAYRKEEEARLAYGNRDDGNNGSYERGSNVGRYLTSLNLFLLALVIAAVAVLIWQAAAFFKPADDVVVPNLVGKTMTDAREIAQQEKFDLAVVDEKYRDNEPEGVIYQMDPSPGRHIREGKQVSIYVSKGPPMTTVPDVRTKTIDQARQILLENNLKLGDNITRAYDSTVDSGLVSDQKPDAGESHPRGSKVEIVVSRGSEPAPSDNPTPEPSDTPTPRPTATPDDSTPTPDPEQHVRTFNIRYPVPNDGAPHHVRIDVVDRDGTRTVYDDTRKAGDQVKQPIEAVGTQIHIRLFDNDKLRSELTK